MLLGLGEQRVRPVDRGAQRLVALDRGAPTAGEQPEALVEQGGDLAGRHADDPRRGELDRERDAVEPAADLGDRGTRCRVEREVRRRAARARSTKSATASLARDRLDVVASTVGHDSERSGRICSPSTASPSRLVARMRTPGHRAGRRSASRPATSSRCSQLSSTSRSRFGAQEVDDASLERHRRVAGSRRARRRSPGQASSSSSATPARRATRRRG